MRKVILVLTLVMMGVSMVSAQVFIGSRQCGMGDTGVASAVGLNAVAYNPAGILEGPKGQFLLSAGFASQGFDQIANSFSNANDPSQFMINNFATNLNANGSISGILGFNVSGIGISLLVPSIMASFNKPAATMAGQASIFAQAEGVLTLGRSFNIPGLPIAGLDVGANLKSISVGYGLATALANPSFGSPATANQTSWQGSGMGYDLGARAHISIPMLTDFSVGLALRDLSQSITYTPKTTTDTYTVATPGASPKISNRVETTGAQTTDNYPTTTAIGAAGTIPGIGLKVAVDLDSVSGGSGILAAPNDTVTDIGVEYPLLMGIILLRGGISSSPIVSRTTLGAKINIPVLTIEMASVMDNKNSSNNATVFDIGAAF